MWSDNPNCSPFHEPDVSRDPESWFSWIDSCIVSDEEDIFPHDYGVGDLPNPPCFPRRWFSNGRCWEITCTNSGPEIWPCIHHPILLERIKTDNQAQIIAIRITSAGYNLRIMTKRGMETVEINHGQLKLLYIARAMANLAILPASNIRNIDENFWVKQYKIIADKM